MQNKISVLIVTYNSLDKFKECFNSLQKIIERSDVFEVLVFDNNSEKETIDFLKGIEKTPKIKIFYSERNLGCGGARKELMSKVSGNKVLILDPDVLIKDENFLDNLIKKENEDSIGIVGCAGGIFDKDKIQFKMLEGGFEGEVDGVCGYCQFFDKSILDNGCEIDSYYFPNGEEDFDFCLQIREKLNKKTYKLSENNFGLVHNYSYTNRGDLDLRNKNFKYMFKKFGLYEKSFFGRLKFWFKSNVLVRRFSRLIGKIKK